MVPRAAELAHGGVGQVSVPGGPVSTDSREPASTAGMLFSGRAGCFGVRMEDEGQPTCKMLAAVWGLEEEGPGREGLRPSLGAVAGEPFRGGG